MANCLSYDCTDELSDHTLNECGEELLGGVPSIVLLECNTQLTDASSASEINAEIAAGRAKLIRNIKVGLPAASPIEVDSLVACGTPVLVNYDRTMSVVDGNVNSDNIGFYNTIFSGRKFGGAILYMCGTVDSLAGEKVLWINASIGFVGSPILPDTNNAFMYFEGTAKWRSKTMGTLVDAPVGIF